MAQIILAVPVPETERVYRWIFVIPRVVMSFLLLLIHVLSVVIVIVSIIPIVLETSMVVEILRSVLLDLSLIIDDIITILVIIYPSKLHI